jgi:hypothetical protein
VARNEDESEGQATEAVNERAHLHGHRIAAKGLPFRRLRRSGVGRPCRGGSRQLPLPGTVGSPLVRWFAQNQRPPI